MHTLFVTVFTIATLLLCARPSHAELPPPTFAVGLGFDISSGTFGTASTSTYVTAPVIIDWFPSERTDVELAIPLLYQRTTTTGHAVLGTGTQSSAKSVALGYRGGAGGSMGGAASPVGSAGNTMNGSASGGGMAGGDFGLGDITLTGGYKLMVESESSPLLRPTLYIKFPTGDESNGFGTGKFDYGVGVAVSKWLGNWQPFTEGRYVVQGASYDETGAKNFLTADAGLAYSWNERLATSAYARFGSPLFEGMSAPLEARLKMVWRFSERLYTDIYALKGFSDSSPDYGGGVSVFMEF